MNTVLTMLGATVVLVAAVLLGERIRLFLIKIITGSQGPRRWE